MKKPEEILENFEEEVQAEPVSEKEEIVEEKTTEEEIVEEPQQSDVSLDDLDDVPETEKYRKIKAGEKVDLKVLTISNVKLGRALTEDREGKHIPPETNNAKSNYYKAKLILEFKEMINDSKVREFVPSIFYSVNANDEPLKIPTIPKACADEKLTDNFTNHLSKIRNWYCKFIGADPKDVSSVSFLKGLIGKKVSFEISSGEFKGREWSKIYITGFVK